MSYQQHQDGSRRGQQQQPSFPLQGINGATAARGSYAMQQYGQQQQAEGYGGPPPSPVVAGSYMRQEPSYVDETYMRQDPSIVPGAGTPIASTASGSGDAAGFMVSAGGATTMGAPLQSFYPASLYGVPTSVYPYQQPGTYPGAYGGGGTGGGAAAGAGGSTAAGSFFGQGGAFARSTNPGQPIQTTTNLQGPDGCNLFVFHIPNTMTNEALFRLFSKFGNVISARIMVEKATGRSRGFGFVSYDNRDSAEKAISQMNGYQIEHKRLKVQHKKDKERDRYMGVGAPSPRMMGPGPGMPAGRMQQTPNYRQPLLPGHGSTLRHHQVQGVVEDNMPPPSPAADTTGSGGIAPGFTVSGGGEEDHRQGGEASTTEVGIDPGSSRSSGGVGGGGGAGGKFGVRANDHPHLAYIYRGRDAATDESGSGSGGIGGGGSGGYPQSAVVGGGDGKVSISAAGVGDEKPQDQDSSGYRARDEYLAPVSSVGGRAATASPDPPKGVSVSRAPSSSPAAAANAVGAATMPHQHQSLEHAMQTKLSIGGGTSPPSASQPS